VTIAETLRKYTSTLKQHGIDEASSEAKVLLCHALNLNSAQLFSQVDRVLTASEIASFESLVDRRLKREPTAYITGHKEFYGLDLYVDGRVLIPRPETEILVEEALNFGRAWIERNGKAPLIADIGTGSGAIAIGLALNLPGSHVYAVDISEKALEAAAINVDRYRLKDRITLIHGNLLEQISGEMALVVANLPYIGEPEVGYLQAEIAKYEPGIALRGGSGGTEVIQSLITQANDKIATGGAILLEIGAGQEQEITRVIRDCMPGSEIALIKDLSGINRVITIDVKGSQRL
jgi:release factor glutamine methyltransferase